MPGNGHVRFGPEVAGKGPAPSGHLAGGLPAPRTRAARYLGYEIIVQHADRKITRGRRTGTPLGSDACRATQTGRCYDNNVPLQGGWSLLLESRRYPGQFNKMEQRGHRYPGRSQSEAGVRQRPV